MTGIGQIMQVYNPGVFETAVVTATSKGVLQVPAEHSVWFNSAGRLIAGPIPTSRSQLTESQRESGDKETWSRISQLFAARTHLSSLQIDTIMSPISQNRTFSGTYSRPSAERVQKIVEGIAWTAYQAATPTDPHVGGIVIDSAARDKIKDVTRKTEHDAQFWKQLQESLLKRFPNLTQEDLKNPYLVEIMTTNSSNEHRADGVRPTEERVRAYVTGVCALSFFNPVSNGTA